MREIPEWLWDVVVCPDDRGALRAAAGGAACETCGTAYGGEGGVLDLLPSRLREPDAEDPAAIWIEEEMRWWNPWYEGQPRRPYSPEAGLRGRSRELNLFGPIRDRLPAQPLVLEMGAGDSRTVAGLWPPARDGLRYTATDMSPPALRAGRELLGPGVASVRCDAVNWPFREGVADVVLILGVLHHLSDWRQALERACASVRPGGFLLLHEAVTKPRVLSRFREHGVDDHWVSPHEGDVPAGALRTALERSGKLIRWHAELSPLGFALIRYGIERFDLEDRLESSRALAAALGAADQAFGRSAGLLAPSLGFNEVSAVWQRDGHVGAGR